MSNHITTELVQRIAEARVNGHAAHYSNLPGNQYAEDHEEMYHNIGQTVVAEEGQTDATLIWSAIENHATATLALAYEQRTANLIAVATAVSENGVYQLDPALIGAAQEELATRLGLGENND